MKRVRFTYSKSKKMELLKIALFGQNVLYRLIERVGKMHFIPSLKNYVQVWRFSFQKNNQYLRMSANAVDNNN